jgi:hypothetical protein
MASSDSHGRLVCLSRVQEHHRSAASQLLAIHCSQCFSCVRQPLCSSWSAEQCVSCTHRQGLEQPCGMEVLCITAITIAAARPAAAASLLTGRLRCLQAAQENDVLIVLFQCICGLGRGCCRHVVVHLCGKLQAACEHLAFENAAAVPALCLPYNSAR